MNYLKNGPNSFARQVPNRVELLAEYIGSGNI